MKALVIVDAQNGFYLDGQEVKSQRHSRALNVISELLYGDFDFDYTFATRFVNSPDSTISRHLGWTEMMEGCWSTRLNDTVEKRVLELGEIVSKCTYSSSLLINRIISLGIDEVVVAGFDTDACVLATVYGLFDSGVKTTVITDGCASSNEKFHRYAVSIMERNLGISNTVGIGRWKQLQGFS